MMQTRHGAGAPGGTTSNSHLLSCSRVFPGPPTVGRAGCAELPWLPSTPVSLESIEGAEDVTPLFLVAIDAVAPGSGKSTVAGALVAELAQRHTMLMFKEADILTDRSFVGVAREFHASGRVAPETLLRCTRRYLAALDGVEIVVLDALLPFIGSLLGWGADESEVKRFVANWPMYCGPSGARACSSTLMEDHRCLWIGPLVARRIRVGWHG